MFRHGGCTLQDRVYSPWSLNETACLGDASSLQCNPTFQFPLGFPLKFLSF